MNSDRNSKHVRDLSAAIEDRMQQDRPPEWRPAFAAADSKAPKQALLDQLKEKFGLEGTDTGVQPDASGGSETQVASADGSNGFANLVRGWLGRA